MSETQKCPICSAEVVFSERYPHYLCPSCSARTVDENGRQLTFSNIDLSGGIAAIYTDTGEEHPGHICYVDGVRCRADEARFGGIVIQAYDQES